MQRLLVRVMSIIVDRDHTYTIIKFGEPNNRLCPSLQEN